MTQEAPQPQPATGEPQVLLRLVKPEEADVVAKQVELALSDIHSTSSMQRVEVYLPRAKPATCQDALEGLTALEVGIQAQQLKHVHGAMACCTAGCLTNTCSSCSLRAWPA